MIPKSSLSGCVYVCVSAGGQEWVQTMIRVQLWMYDRGTGLTLWTPQYYCTLYSKLGTLGACLKYKLQNCMITLYYVNHHSKIIHQTFFIQISLMMRLKVTYQLAPKVIPRETSRTSRMRTILRASLRARRRTSRRTASPRTSSSRTGTNRIGMVRCHFLPFPRYRLLQTEAFYKISEKASSPIFWKHWKSKGFAVCWQPKYWIHFFFVFLSCKLKNTNISFLR